MRHRLSRALPVLDWAPRYRRADLSGDLAAGITMAAMLIPQAMAYALLAGLPPEVGLYASTAPLVAYAVFGTSRQMAVGPAAIMSLLTASALGNVAAEGSATYVEAAAVLALLVGGISLVLGLGRLGFVTNLLSHPVLVGFTAAVAVIIAASQARHLLGVPAERHDRAYEDLAEVVRHAGDASWATVAVGVGSLAALWLLRRRVPRVPGALAVVVAGVGAVRLFDLGQRDVAVVGEIPGDLPAFSLPGLDGALVADLLPTAVVIAMVGFLQSIAVAKFYGRRNRYEVDPNGELIGLGAANLAAGVFGGHPVSGGFARTAVNVSAGARTQAAALITVAILLVALVTLTPVLADVPQAVLAAIVIMAVTGLVDVAEARRIARTKPTDLVTLGFAFAATLALGVEVGVLAAAGLSLALIVVRMSRPHTAELGRLPGRHVFRNMDRYPDVEPIPGAAILRLDVSLSYLNSTFLKRRIAALRERHGDTLRAIVLDCSGINDIDSTAERTLADLDEELAVAGIELHLASVKGPVRDVLHRSGLADRLDSRVHLDLDEAFSALAGRGDR